jgi:hypothetical protein
MKKIMSINQVLVGIGLALATGQALAVPGDAWVQIAPGPEDSQFDAKVYVDAATERVGAYQIEVTYDPSQGIEIDTSAGTNSGVSPGADGFVTVANTSVPGHVIVNGFNTAGYPGSKEMHLVTIHFNGQPIDADSVNLSVDELASTEGKPIGR